MYEVFCMCKHLQIISHVGRLKCGNIFDLRFLITDKNL